MRPPVKITRHDSERVRTEKTIRTIDDIYSNLGSVNRVTDVVTEELHIVVGSGGVSGGGMATVDHNILKNLTVGDVHTQYAYLAGRSGGQTLYGGYDASDNFTISSTANGTKGHIYFGASGAFIDFNEVDERVGINAATTSAWKLRIHSTSDQEFWATHQTDDAVGATFLTYKQRGATTECNDADEVFSLDNRFLNDNSEYVVAGEYRVIVDDVTDGTEDGHIDLYAMTATNLTKALGVYGTHLALPNRQEFRWYDNGNYVGFEAPALTGDQIWTLPSADGTANQAVITDGNGVLSFGSAAAAAHTHDGDTLQLDGINSNGGAFPFTTSGAVTFSQNVLIGAAGSAMTFDVTNERIAINTTTTEPWKLRIHSTSDYELFMTHQTADAVGATIMTYKERGYDTAAQDNDEVFSLESKFLNDGTPKTYEMAGQYRVIVDDITDGTEDSHLVFSVLNGGSAADSLEVYGDYIKVNDYIKFLERSSDPPEPADGEAIMWMSDGTGKGADGDILVASNAAGSTHYGIIFIRASNPGW